MMIIHGGWNKESSLKGGVSSSTVKCKKKQYTRRQVGDGISVFSCDGTQ